VHRSPPDLPPNFRTPVKGTTEWNGILMAPYPWIGNMERLMVDMYAMLFLPLLCCCPLQPIVLFFHVCRVIHLLPLCAPAQGCIRGMDQLFCHDRAPSFNSLTVAGFSALHLILRKDFLPSSVHFTAVSAPFVDLLLLLLLSIYPLFVCHAPMHQYWSSKERWYDNSSRERITVFDTLRSCHFHGSGWGSTTRPSPAYVLTLGMSTISQSFRHRKSLGRTHLPPFRDSKHVPICQYTSHRLDLLLCHMKYFVFRPRENNACLERDHFLSNHVCRSYR
jgi:hypothetical protein